MWPWLPERVVVVHIPCVQRRRDSVARHFIQRRRVGTNIARIPAQPIHVAPSSRRPSSQLLVLLRLLSATISDAPRPQQHDYGT